MKESLLAILFLVSFIPSLKAQDDLLDKWIISRIEAKNSDIFYVDSYYNIRMPEDKLVKKIAVEKRWVGLNTKPILLEYGIDSARYYGGNCFKMTYYDYSNTHIIGKEDQVQMTGEIYKLNSAEIAEIRSRMEQYQPPKEIERENYRALRDTQEIVYDVNVVLQYGGESKFALFLPKFNVLRKHKFKPLNAYYGAEFGLHYHLVGGFGSLSAIVGIEKGIFNAETSVSRFWSSGTGDGEYKDPSGQNLLNLKVGIGTEDIKLKLGTSFVLSENLPLEQGRDPLLDIGKINNRIWSFEFQFTLNN